MISDQLQWHLHLEFDTSVGWRPCVVRNLYAAAHRAVIVWQDAEGVWWPEVVPYPESELLRVRPKRSSVWG